MNKVGNSRPSAQETTVKLHGVTWLEWGVWVGGGHCICVSGFSALQVWKRAGRSHGLARALPFRAEATVSPGRFATQQRHVHEFWVAETGYAGSIWVLSMSFLLWLLHPPYFLASLLTSGQMYCGENTWWPDPMKHRHSRLHSFGACCVLT